MFAPGGFDPRRDIAGIILNRWGHAYVNPQPKPRSGARLAPAVDAAGRVKSGRPHWVKSKPHMDLGCGAYHFIAPMSPVASPSGRRLWGGPTPPNSGGASALPEHPALAL